ncbi:12474_t:CDS:1, partial [Acaulospora colombiana]
MDSISASEIHNRDGKGAFQSENYSAAYRHYSFAIEVANPKCAKYYLNRARTNLKMNQYMFAYEDAEEALTLDP